jgi:hypothetical protein
VPAEIAFVALARDENGSLVRGRSGEQLGEPTIDQRFDRSRVTAGQTAALGLSYCERVCELLFGLAQALRSAFLIALLWHFTSSAGIGRVRARSLSALARMSSR